MIKWKYLLMDPNSRFEYFLKQNPHRAFSADEMAKEFRVSKETFTCKYPPRHLESAWEESDPKGEALPAEAPYGQNVEDESVRYHKLPSGIRIRVVREKEVFTEISKEVFTVAPHGRDKLFCFRVPTAWMPLYEGHPSLFLVCLGLYFYLEPDFSNLSEILVSIDQYLLEREKEEADQAALLDQQKRQLRSVPDQCGSYHY